MGKILAPFRYPHVGACCKASVRFELVPETSSRYVPLAPSGKISHGASGGPIVPFSRRSSEKRVSHSLKLVVERVVNAALQSRSHFEWVIQASRKQAEPIIEGGKAEYYHAAAHGIRFPFILERIRPQSHPRQTLILDRTPQSPSGP